jgi:hypothetical protein
VVLAGVILAALISLVVRFRRARGVERQQLKWFAYGTGLLFLLPATAIIGAEFANLAGNLVTAAIGSAIPVTIGLAVLRCRLYDIDRFISRTLVYTLLTALLGLCYVAGSLLFVLVAGAGADPPSWLVAAATLAAAAVFRPARRRIQAMVDRRFNRRRYNAAQTIQAFSTRLRDQVDLDTLSTELVAVAGRTMEPTLLSLWIRLPTNRLQPTR